VFRAFREATWVERVVCLVVVAFFAWMVVAVNRASDRCAAEGGTYVGKTMTCVHSPRPAPSRSAG